MWLRFVRLSQKLNIYYFPDIKYSDKKRIKCVWWNGNLLKFLKFADDTTIISVIQDGDKSAYRQQVEHLAI